MWCFFFLIMYLLNLQVCWLQLIELWGWLAHKNNLERCASVCCYKNRRLNWPHTEAIVKSEISRSMVWHRASHCPKVAGCGTEESPPHALCEYLIPNCSSVSHTSRNPCVWLKDMLCGLCLRCRCIEDKWAIPAFSINGGCLVKKWCKMVETVNAKTGSLNAIFVLTSSYFLSH